MPAYDGTELAFHVRGDGNPLVCLPGGPMQDSAYLGDLGGLAAHVRLVLLDYRGTRASGTPADTSSYRCDRLVDDVEALREHLGLHRMSLLAHSGGANLAVLYAARHPERVDRLVLVTPSTYAVGISATSDVRRAVVRLRQDEPWYESAAAAFERVAAGQGTDRDGDAITPLTYGRWDAVAQDHHAKQAGRRNAVAAEVFGSEGAYDPPSTRACLAALHAPVLLLAGEWDVAAPPPVMAELAALFADATLVVQPAAGHSPWLDDPAAFTATVAQFLGAAPAAT